MQTISNTSSKRIDFGIIIIEFIEIRYPIFGHGIGKFSRGDLVFFDIIEDALKLLECYRIVYAVFLGFKLLSEARSDKQCFIVRSILFFYKSIHDDHRGADIEKILLEFWISRLDYLDDSGAVGTDISLIWMFFEEFLIFHIDKLGCIRKFYNLFYTQHFEIEDNIRIREIYRKAGCKKANDVFMLEGISKCLEFWSKRHGKAK